jgi:hypothetical protein
MSDPTGHLDKLAQLDEMPDLATSLARGAWPPGKKPRPLADAIPPKLDRAVIGVC